MNPYVVLTGFVITLAVGLMAIALLRRAERLDGLRRWAEEREALDQWNPGLHVKRGQHVPAKDDHEAADYIARNW